MTIFAIVQLEHLQDLVDFAEDHVEELDSDQLIAAMYCRKVVNQRRAKDEPS